MNLKLMVRVVLILASGIVWVSTDSLMYACTGFMQSDGEMVLVGNNEDSKIPYTRVWFMPAESGSFGRVYFGYDNWSPQGGMNDQVLFFDYFLHDFDKEIIFDLREELKKGPQMRIGR